MHSRQELGGRLPASTDVPGFVFVAQVLQALVAFPPIGDRRGTRLYRLPYEGMEASGRGVRNAFQPDAPDAIPIDLSGDHH